MIALFTIFNIKTHDARSMSMLTSLARVDAVHSSTPKVLVWIFSSGCKHISAAVEIISHRCDQLLTSTINFSKHRFPTPFSWPSGLDLFNME